jgi:hypothetical protein
VMLASFALGLLAVAPATAPAPTTTPVVVRRTEPRPSFRHARHA